MKLLVTGATGFIGRTLVAEAKRRGHSVVAVSRDPTSARVVLPGVMTLPWNPERDPLPREALEGVEAVIHLAGENVAKGRWTRKKMGRIRSSRVMTTRNVVASMAKAGTRTLVCASAIGWYGDRGDDVLREEEPAAPDFLGTVCREWEDGAARARDHSIRVVSVRIGIVLGREGGALQAMRTPFKLNLGGRIGSGRQWMSWIHIDDVVGILLHAAENSGVSGPLNATAPEPVSNGEFTRILGRVLKKWTFLPMPGFILRLVLGKFAGVLLASQRCDSARAAGAGYVFRHASLEEALRTLLK